jgi:hypothetical protein
MMNENKAINDKMVFVVNNQQSPQDSDLLHLEWAVISQLDGQKSVGQIAENLALNAGEIQEIFRKLLKANLLVLVNRDAEDDYVPQEFFKQLNHDMTYMMGPVAGIILEDVLGMMNVNKEKLSKESLPSLIDLLTIQIDDPVKQIEFQKKVYPRIKSMFFQ